MTYEIPQFIRDDATLSFALDFATRAHSGQYRKNSGVEYITHPIAVCAILKRVCDDIDMLAAALLHDVVEDTMFTFSDIKLAFGDGVARLVAGLTSPSTYDEDYKDLPRKERKAIDADALKSKCDRVKTIKLADTLHNLSDHETCKPRFLAVYIPEKRYAATILKDGGCAILHAELLALLETTGY